MTKLITFIILMTLNICIFSQSSLIPKGNGVIVDDVAQDVNCDGSEQLCRSKLIASINENLELANQHFYIFPDIASLNLPPNDKKKANTDCNNISQYVFNYSSLPLIKSSILKMPELGQCLPGKVITKTYNQSQTKGAKRIVMPMINGSAYWLNQASDEQLVAVANIIAETINNDNNAGGVSFDIEGPTMNTHTTEIFIGQLAKKLIKNNKLIAVFDPKLEILAKISQKYHNIIALAALYDYGLNPDKPYAPINLNRYKSYTGNHAVKGYFGGYGKNIPVMFVTPAAATTTLYEHLNLYNKDMKKGNFNLTGISQTPTSCSKEQLPIDILDKFLISPPDQNNSSAVDYFLSQCKRFNNQQASQSAYFNASLQAITQGYQSNQNPNKYLVGTALYNHKPNGFYGLTCAKNSWNIYYTESLHKKCLGFYPDAISNDIWQLLNKWKIPGVSVVSKENNNVKQ